MLRFFSSISFPILRLSDGIEHSGDSHLPSMIRSSYTAGHRYSVDHRFSAGHRLANRFAFYPSVRRLIHLIQPVVKNPLVIGGGLWLSLWLWSWPLALAIASGTGVAIAVYLFQLDRLHVSWFHRFSETDAVLGNQNVWQQRLEIVGDQWGCTTTRLWGQCWRPINRPLTLALLSGGFGASVVATVAFIYRDLHSLSLVLVTGLQLVMVGIIGVGFWQQSSSLSSQSAATSPANREVFSGAAQRLERTDIIDQLWADLTSQETAIRLVAIYRAVNWVQSNQLSHDNEQRAIAPNVAMGMDAQKLTACLRVMLSQESNPNVQQALRDSLMTLQNFNA